jgi:hypothetical protein
MGVIQSLVLGFDFLEMKGTPNHQKTNAPSFCFDCCHSLNVKLRQNVRKMSVATVAALTLLHQLSEMPSILQRHDIIDVERLHKNIENKEVIAQRILS